MTTSPISFILTVGGAAFILAGGWIIGSVLLAVAIALELFLVET